MAVENSLLEIPCVNEKLTEIGVVKNGCRKRKPNFSAKEIVIITKMFEENQAILLAKFIRTNTYKAKRDHVYGKRLNTIAIKAIETQLQTEVVVKSKKSGRPIVEQEQRKTGGDSPTKMPSRSTNKMWSS